MTDQTCTDHEKPLPCGHPRDFEIFTDAGRSNCLACHVEALVNLRERLRYCLNLQLANAREWQQVRPGPCRLERGRWKHLAKIAQLALDQFDLPMPPAE